MKPPPANTRMNGTHTAIGIFHSAGGIHSVVGTSILLLAVFSRSASGRFRHFAAILPTYLANGIRCVLPQATAAASPLSASLLGYHCPKLQSLLRVVD